MADIKATSFRVNDDDIAKFKEFAEKEGYNQAEAFKSIMQTVEMAKAKSLIKDRAKEIEVFQDTINNLMSYFLNSLNVNQTSEERIREELSQELQTKDNTIGNLYEQLQDSKADNKVLKDENNKSIEENKQLKFALDKANELFEDGQNAIDKLNKNNDLLQEQLSEYKEYKDNYKTLLNNFEKLKSELDEVKEHNSKLNNDNELLNNKVKANEDMINFYKTEIDNKDKNISEYKADIRALESKFNKQIEDIQKANEKSLNEQLKNNIDNLNNKYEVELSKKDLEIQRLNNLLEQLQPQTKTKRKVAKEGE